MTSDDALSHPLSGDNAPFLIFHGTANQDLAENVARALNVHPAECLVERFPDSEVRVQISESVRGRDAYIIQSTCSTVDSSTNTGYSVNEHLMELFVMLDTLHRANAARVTAIIPYYGYARQDRKSAGREPITAKLVANLLTAAGASRVLCVDLHSPAVQGFFDIGMDHLSAMQMLAQHIQQLAIKDAVIVSPDTGGVKRAETFANLIDLPLAILHKKRSDARFVQIQSVVGDVQGKRPIIVDDIISTGGTLRRAADALLQAGALPEISIVATHPVLTPDVFENLRHPAIRHIVVTDSIPVSAAKRQRLPALEVVSLAPLLSKAIERLHEGRSLSELYREYGELPMQLPFGT
jgi:ribose-phosphate pyrophosphokinase